VRGASRVFADTVGTEAELREITGEPGGAAVDVASNLVGLVVYIAAAEGRRDEALAEEAREIAESSGARRILRQIEEARSSISNHQRGG